MNEDDLERLLADALDAQARAQVGDHSTPPVPRFVHPEPTSGHRHWRTRVLAPLAAAAVVIGVVVAATTLSGSAHHGAPVVAGNSTPAPVSTSAPAPANTVHVKLLNDDGARYGVGMPVIAYFSRWITDARPLQRATVATVDGKPMQGAWYFERSDAGKGPIEAHFRLARYWPANSDVKVSIPIKGLSAGGGLHYDDSLTTEFHTGAANIATVDDRTHHLTLRVNGKPAGSYPVSLGTATAPTRPGIKVIMERPGTITVRGAGYSRKVQYAQRLTYAGEYLLAAPWNVKNIDAGVNSSDGSTDLLPADAHKLFGILEIGDVVQYKHTNGAQMAMSSGYGDWNVKWSTWLEGGLVRTH